MSLLSLLFSLLAVLPSVSYLLILSSDSSPTGSSSSYSLFIPISSGLLGSKSVTSSGKYLHQPILVFLQAKSVICGASIHEVGTDCHNLAANTACNMWYFSRDLPMVSKEHYEGLLCCNNLLLNVLLLTLLTEEQLKPHVLHTNSSITLNNS